MVNDENPKSSKNNSAIIRSSAAETMRKNMGLSTWQDAPGGKIQKFDVSVAKTT
jgi:hypothetical protein